ncbi:uncharacterized protein LOC144093507 [Amblyomma americanum]
MVHRLNPTALIVLLLLLACAAVRAAPPPKGGSSRSSGSSSSSSKPAAALPPQDSSGGFLDAVKAASGQVQNATDKFPVSYNMAAMRFQNWAQENKATISKTATDILNFARTIFQPIETELRKKPSRH